MNTSTVYDTIHGIRNSVNDGRYNGKLFCININHISSYALDLICLFMLFKQVGCRYHHKIVW